MKELTLEETKKIGYSILCDIDTICKKNNITYFLAYGTLIGAARHNGFIPWDDDIDLWIPINEYSKLMDALERESNFTLLNWLSQENWPLVWSKLSDMSTAVISNGISTANNMRRGVSVDLFPIFPCWNDDKWINVLTRSSKEISRKFYHRKFARSLIRPKWLVTYFYCKLTDIMGKDIIYWKHRLYDMIKDNPTTGLIGFPLSPYKKNDIHMEECFSSALYLKFEDRYFPVPIGYKQILNDIYGDYMVPPPKEEQVPKHDVKIYRL